MRFLEPLPAGVAGAGFDLVVVTPLSDNSLEQPTLSAGAKSGAVAQKSSESLPDPRLQAILSFWPSLPECLKDAIFFETSKSAILLNITN